MQVVNSLRSSCSGRITLKKAVDHGLNTFLRGLANRAYQATFKFSEMQHSYNRKQQGIPHHSTLKFGHAMTDHMFEVYWNCDRGWGKPSIDEYRPILLDPAAKCLHYSVELFEGMKAYCGADRKIRLFRPTENFIRMNESATRACLPNFDSEELRLCLHKFVEIEKDWVPDEEGCSLYIRPTMIGTEPTLGVSASTDAMLYIIASPVGPYFPSGMKPVSLLADSKYVRAWPGGAGNSKLGSNYGPTIYVQNEAQKKDCQQVLWLYGDNEIITEAGTMNLFVRLINEDGEDELITAPLEMEVILPGVVRKSVLQLASAWGNIKVTERAINMKELIQAQKQGRLLEVFGSGTACVICPVDRIHYKNSDIHIPTMVTPDPVFKKLYEELNDIYYGRRVSWWGEVVCDA